MSSHFGHINKGTILYDAIALNQGWIMQQLASNGALVLKLVHYKFSMSLVRYCLICMQSVGVIVASDFYFFVTLMCSLYFFGEIIIKWGELAFSFGRDITDPGIQTCKV